MIFLFSLFFIILFHEAGHLFAAKLCKCGVTKFSVGFGKPLWSKKIKETTYQIAPLLLGGYCELFGELQYSRSKKAFTNKTYGQKCFIAYAGIIVNIITGLIAGLFGYLFHNIVLFYFAYYSIVIGVSNALPFIPCLDGSFPIIFLFEKFWGKRKTYKFWSKVNLFFFKWLMIFNILSIPYLIYLIWSKKIL
jgi:membrane-associated protease RseP (regulator of RpoE activity)